MLHASQAEAHSRPNSPSQLTLHATLEQGGDSLGVSTAVNTVIVMAQVNAAQKLLEDALETGMDLSQFLSSLRELGITANKQESQSMSIPYSTSTSPSNVMKSEMITRMRNIDNVRVIKPVINSPVQPDKEDNLPASKEEHEISTISKTILALAPHLGKISGENICTDPHLNKMRRLTLAYGAERSMDVLINRAQLKCLCEPIPHSIWKKIILDHYINFEHLYAALE
ncbi:hypothetical protein H0H87_001144 [Tephrocybe sp. NHM501043]|nr:hypothetical protein H0H87_001144 [Tephrocybe sp. NHM501043]